MRSLASFAAPKTRSNPAVTGSAILANVVSAGSERYVIAGMVWIRISPMLYDDWAAPAAGLSSARATGGDEIRVNTQASMRAAWRMRTSDESEDARNRRRHHDTVGYDE